MPKELIGSEADDYDTYMKRREGHDEDDLIREYEDDYDDPRAYRKAMKRVAREKSTKRVKRLEK